jgi:predicted ATPase/DNA-binding SARP family transcriptional activator
MAGGEGSLGAAGRVRGVRPRLFLVPSTLTLLHRVCWNGTPVAGERSQTLLAVLAQHREGATIAQLVAEVWGDEPPANPAKALQVVVSRTRAATAPELVERTPQGYRLGDVEVDAVRLASLVRGAQNALAQGEVAAAQADARAALALGAEHPAYGASGALARVHETATDELSRARLLLGIALSRGGEHDEALSLLEGTDHHHDEPALACLLRSEAAVRGAGVALERYERHRADLAGRLGIDPGPELQRLHGELLAADRPVREGVHFDATPLLGRDEDLRALRGLVDAARVTSIVGAGGLGKTRLAHVLARRVDQPVVHFIELAGVVAPEDVVGEVGSALGVRDSVSSRRDLTREQRADVRTRIAQQLDRASTLLVLDNCEHVIAAVADLVAFLVATTRDLRVVTTSRAPLAIAAERVYALGELETDDAVELFVQRARSARPSVSLDRGVVADVVTRLDGLPLAVELAAAKVRVMSVEDISRRLEHRFALLRGGDRSAPDRHRTLLAVIDWSWNLLADRERHALRVLSVFQDGFSLDTAEEVLGSAALELVQHLADQSLLTVTDAVGSVRYRMLETVREFGRMQLVDAGEDEAARSLQRAWAHGYAGRYTPQLHSPQEFAAIDALEAEEANLADVLHLAVAEPDREVLVVLLAALGTFWSIRGEHGRVFTLIDAVERALEGWEPPPELVEQTRTALCMLITNALIGYPGEPTGLIELLRQVGTGPRGTALGGVATIVLALDPQDPASGNRRIDALCDDPDRHVARQALQYRSHVMENAGDPQGGLQAAKRCVELWREEDGPWAQAIMHTLLAELHSELGDIEEAARHAALAVPVLDRLGADDDAGQARQIIALAAIAREDLDAAERILDEVDERGRNGSGLRAAAMRSDIGRAELDLARREVAKGLARYRSSVVTTRTVRLPGMGESTGLEPWIMFSESAALTAYAVHARGEEGADLWDHLRLSALRSVRGRHEFVDYPILGLVLYSLGLGGLLREALPAPDAVRLLVLADRFGYNRFVPTMAWENASGPAERLASGAIARLQQEYGDRRGEELLEEAGAFVEQLFGDQAGARRPAARMEWSDSAAEERDQS